MILSKTFYWGQDNQDNTGWIPSGIPEANVVFNSITAVHDMMEHCADNSVVRQDSFANEICALGAVLFIRRQFDVEKFLKSEISEILNCLREQDYPKAEQKYFVKIDAYSSNYVLNIEDAFSGIRKGVVEYLHNTSDDSLSAKERLREINYTSDFVKNTMAWLICGYENAARIYSDMPEYTEDVFRKCQTVWKRFIDYQDEFENWDNRECVFYLDTESAESWVEIEEPEYEPELEE